MENELIGRPENGWEQNCMYLVEVAYDRFNVIHRALFYSGFLHNGKPGGYNMFFNPTYGIEVFGQGALTFDQAYYLKIIRKLLDEKDMRIEKPELVGDRWKEIQNGG